MPDPNQLISALSDPSLSALSDADAAAALNAPVLTPRRERITVTTLSADAVWGPTKTGAFLRKLDAASQTSDDAFAALRVLSGPGFDVSDPAARRAAAMFVSAQLCSQPDADVALNTVSYPAGAPDVTEADVTAARATIANRAGYQAARQAAADSYNSAVTWLDAQQAANAAPPSPADVLARLGNPQAGG
jgi:hypothetical protein